MGRCSPLSHLIWHGCWTGYSLPGPYETGMSHPSPRDGFTACPEGRYGIALADCWHHKVPCPPIAHSCETSSIQRNGLRSSGTAVVAATFFFRLPRDLFFVRCTGYCECWFAGANNSGDPGWSGCCSLNSDSCKRCSAGWMIPLAALLRLRSSQAWCLFRDS